VAGLLIREQKSTCMGTVPFHDVLNVSSISFPQNFTGKVSSTWHVFLLLLFYEALDKAG
jgi:hypothetical protein